MVTALVLALCCVALFAPAPVVLSRARWPSRAPRAAIVLWQAIGLAGGLAAISAWLAVAVIPFHVGMGQAVLTLARRALSGRPLSGFGVKEVLAFVMAIGVALVLVGGLLRTMAGTYRARCRHSLVLDQVGESNDRLPGAMFLDHPQAVAYCLPGLRPRIVLSAGALGVLGPREVDAVVAHERGHAHAHHDLVLIPFTSFVALLRWMPYARLAPRSVSTLLEMAADDFACRSHSRQIVAASLVHLATAGTCRVPACAFSATSSAVSIRVRRLLAASANSRGIGALALAVACTVLAAPFLAMLGPSLAH
jgi:Zn-dependent protease with chaperone function